MSFRAKRELLVQVAPRYREATHAQTSVVLNKVLAAHGYARKYAIPAPRSAYPATRTDSAAKRAPLWGRRAGSAADRLDRGQRDLQ